MQNPQYKKAKEIVSADHAYDYDLLRAQVHATLAVAELVNSLIEITVETRQADQIEQAQKKLRD